MDLFQPEQSDNSQHPLAERMRPDDVENYIGQRHIAGPDGVLTQQLKSGSLFSMIVWGPPGCGKTTLARMIAKQSDCNFHQLSAVTAGVKDVKNIIDTAHFNLKSGVKTLLFIDEIHRFNKAQQDVLLKCVEEGTITLIGATTENPSFEVISPLLSRCRVYHLKSHTEDDLNLLLDRTIKTDLILCELNIKFDKKARTALIFMSGGDARILLNALEAVVSLVQQNNIGDLVITTKDIEQVLQKKSSLYDKKGEYHFDLISAFIKSIRGSDPDAALYWMTRMLENGEDPKFIARRMIILASEDIGNADPTALTLATSAFSAVDYVGMPEAAIVLSHVVTYLASTVKSNASYMALKAAKKEIKDRPDAEVPMHLRNAPTKMMKAEGYGAGYKYPHNHEGNFTLQSYLPEEFKGSRFYFPTENGIEKRIKERLENLWGNKKPGQKPGHES